MSTLVIVMYTAGKYVISMQIIAKGIIHGWTIGVSVHSLTIISCIHPISFNPTEGPLVNHFQVWCILFVIYDLLLWVPVLSGHQLSCSILQENQSELMTRHLEQGRPHRSSVQRAYIPRVARQQQCLLINRICSTSYVSLEPQFD